MVGMRGCQFCSATICKCAEKMMNGEAVEGKFGRDDWIRTSDPLTPSQRFRRFPLFSGVHPIARRLDNPLF
jgi:hypothetical protein